MKSKTTLILLVITAAVAVFFQHVQDVVEQVQADPVVAHAPFLPWPWRAGE